MSGLIPAGSLVFTGYGDAGSMRFLSPAGALLGQPTPNDPEPGSGVSAIKTLVGSNALAVCGGNTPNFGSTGTGTFNSDGSFRAQYLHGGGSSYAGFGGGRDDAGGFYTCKSQSANLKIFKYDADCALVSSWTVAMGFTIGSVQAMGVNGAGTIAYVHLRKFSGATAAEVYAVDLAGAGSNLGVFASDATSTSLQGQTCVIGLTNGDVIIAWRHANNVKRYNAAGTLQATYTLPGSLNPMALAYGLNPATTFWVGAYSSAATFSSTTVYEVRISDGTILNQFDPEDGSFEFDSSFTVLAVAMGSPAPVPLGTPSTPQIDCTPQTTVGNGGTGAAGCNTGGVGFVPSYTGPWGDVPDHDDPVDGETLSDKDGQGVEAWVEVNHVDYPSGDVEPILRAMVPLADPADYEGGYKTDGLLAVGDVEHALGNERGGFEATTVDVQLTDARDNAFRALADDQEVEGDELLIKLASDAGRKASVAPRVLTRALVRKMTLRSMRQVSLSAVDQIYSEQGQLGPAVPFPAFTYNDLGRGAPDMTADTKATPIPILIGEKTDAGARDPLTGALKSKGRIPLTYLGKFLVSGLPTPAATTGRSVADIAAAMQASIAAGTLATDFPDLGAGDTAALIALGTVPTTYEGLAAARGVDVGSSGFEGIGYSDLDALMATGTTAAPTAQEWGILSGGLGPWSAWTGVGGSDLGGGDPQATHDRVMLDIAARAGSDLLVPGDGVCPWDAFTITNPDTGRVFDLACIGVRGPLLDDHLNGIVNITANGIGLMGANGYPIGRLMDAAQFVTENFMVANKSAGPWVTTSTAPKWSDGTPIVNSSSFAARQQQFIDALGGDGILASWFIHEQAPKTEWMVRLQEWTETKMTGADAHGQIRAFGLDVAADTSAWPVVYHEVDVFGPVEMSFGEDRENVATGVCDEDPDAQKFGAGPITEKHLVGIARLGKGVAGRGEKPGAQTIENAMICNVDHLRWLLQQRVARLGLGVKLITITGRRGWLDYNLGQGILFNSDDGPGPNGYVNHPFIVLRRRFQFASQLVTYTLWDVRDALLSSRFVDGLSRLSEITDTDAAAAVVTDDADVAALVLA